MANTIKDLFGLKLTGQNQLTASKKVRKSFVLPDPEDAISVEASAGFFGQYLDLDGVTRTDADLIYKYREMSMHPEVESAIDDIVCEAIVTEDNQRPVKIIMDDFELGSKVKDRVAEEFENILRLLSFQTKGYEIFRRWYVDGKIVYHVIVDEASREKGIAEVRYIDPTNIQKVKKYEKDKTPTIEGEKLITKVEEFYVYSRDGFRAGTAQGLKISPDAIAFVTSGLYDSRNKRSIGYLHKAIKTLNQLRMIEDAIVIYRLARAPERRVFYVDVGNLPKAQAEEYLKSLMNRHRNKLIYDASTGEMRDDKRHMSMIEDYWMPRREGGKGTEITTLPGACLAMDTKVSLLDGRNLSIKEIAEEIALGKTLWTYSCHPTTGEVAPGLISWAGVTKESAKVMKITLDNGEEIVCTPDHKFPIYGKGFVEAKDLEINSSLIPLYKKHDYKIVKIEYLADPIQVGTLTIDAEEKVHNYHTFALSAGVFTKNSNLNEIKDLEYFQKKLYKSLNVPYSRNQGDQKSFNIGRSTEITRDEVKFAKFINRLRNKFNELFYFLLKTQLILKNIITADDWEDMRHKIFFDYLKDSFFAELKHNEVNNDRMNVLNAMQPYIGKYYSNHWIQKNILGFTDEEILDMQKEIQEEAEMEAEVNQQKQQDSSLNMSPGGNVPPGNNEIPPEQPAQELGQSDVPLPPDNTRL